MGLQNGTFMSKVDSRHLVNVRVLAEACKEHYNQEVINFLGGVVERQGVAAYDYEGKISQIANDEGYRKAFYVDRDELGRYFDRGESGDSNIAASIERVLDQI